MYSHSITIIVLLTFETDKLNIPCILEIEIHCLKKHLVSKAALSL